MKTIPNAQDILKAVALFNHVKKKYTKFVQFFRCGQNVHMRNEKVAQGRAQKTKNGA